MTQPTANEQLSAYLDGELSTPESMQLERQLERDPELRAELNSLRDAMDFTQLHGPLQAPTNLLAHVLEAVKDEPMPTSWWQWFNRPFGLPIQGIAVAAVAAVVLFIAIPVSTVSLGLFSDETKQDLAALVDSSRSRQSKEDPPEPLPSTEEDSTKGAETSRDNTDWAAPEPKKKETGYNDSLSKPKEQLNEGRVQEMLNADMDMEEGSATADEGLAQGTFFFIDNAPS